MPRCWCVRQDGTECSFSTSSANAVQRSSRMMWPAGTDPRKTAERFKPLPERPPPARLPVLPEIASPRATVRRDEEGYLYFISAATR